jgi:deoxyribose-phosphate aldolase
MELARSIEHTLLRADATSSEVAKLCDEALTHGFAGVCVNPVHVPVASQHLLGRAAVVSVVGFPLGAGSQHSDLAEADWLMNHGCQELDWVVPIGLAKDTRWDEIATRTRALRQATKGAVLKVILETGYFEPEALQRLCASVLEGEPDFLKTSTGFGPRGASVDDVVRLTQASGGRVAVKASGGIRTLGQAYELLRAGASRLGTSSGVSLVRELQTQSERDA